MALLTLLMNWRLFTRKMILRVLYQGYKHLYIQHILFPIISCRADMWAILGMYAVQKTIENNNEKCSDCEEVPDLEVVYTTGRNVGQLRQQLRIV